MRLIHAVFVGLFLVLNQAANSAEPFRFERQVVDPKIGAVCYAVTIADVDGDQKPDVVALSEDALVWYQNPSWKKHDVIRGATARDNVCVQARDLDGDGRIDFVVGAGWRPTDTTRPSTLQWISRDSAGDWKLMPIPYSEPTLHRLRLGDVKGTGSTQVVVAPLQGRGTKGPDWGDGAGARILVYDVPQNPRDQPWPVEFITDSLHTVHNLQLVNLDKDQADEILVASWEGVFVLDRDAEGRWIKEQIGEGDFMARPFQGSSEVKLGRLKDGRVYVATIEPWHGRKVVVYEQTRGQEPAGPLFGRGLWTRMVVAEPHTWGHGLWCVDLNGDGNEELVVGQRDPNPKDAPGPGGPGVFVFDPQPGPEATRFRIATVDDGGVACEDLIAADLDGDGRPEIVAGGRATHNVVVYWNKTPASGKRSTP